MNSKKVKRIGLLGGMSWESTLHYYRIINETVKARLGGHHSADLVLRSLDFAPVETMQRRGAWKEAGACLAVAAQECVAAGAEAIVLCTNTMHLVAGAITGAVKVPLIHIAEATGEAIKGSQIRRVGLLGTAFTMEQDFYRRRLEEAAGIEVVVPADRSRQLVHRVIFEELVHGVLRPESRRAYLEVCGELAGAGAEGIVLGCTEIGMLIREGDVPLPLFDTTEIHATAAVTWALAGD
ncbi:MAG: aspartate/glutamate racemase family protein [Spirochaetaceae bacterium]